MKDKWVFAQYAPMIRQRDFEYLINKARKRGWVCHRALENQPEVGSSKPANLRLGS
jgi:hypothetical protein